MMNTLLSLRMLFVLMLASLVKTRLNTTPMTIWVMHLQSTATKTTEGSFNLIYYMASSASGQDEPNPAL